VDGREAACERGGSTGLRVIVYDDDLETAEGLLEEQGIETTGQRFGAVEGRDHHRDLGNLIELRRSVNDRPSGSFCRKMC
jgi:hypothetical protein